MCSPAALDDADCHTPRMIRTDSMKALEAEALEAAAALTEMAGGPRVHPSCSPPSVRAPEQPLLHGFGAPRSPGQWVSPNKDNSCCTPAKRPAAVPLWDGAIQRFCLFLLRCFLQSVISAPTGRYCFRKWLQDLHAPPEQTTET